MTKLRVIAGGRVKDLDGMSRGEVLSLEVLDDLLAKKREALRMLEAREKTRALNGVDWGGEIAHLKGEIAKLVTLRAEMI